MAKQVVYQFYAELEDFKPKIWRRFQVAGNITVAWLGYTVMTMYKMEANHLLAIEHKQPLLTFNGKQSNRMGLVCRYNISNEYGSYMDMGGKNATKIKLSQLNLTPSSCLNVLYDFGDGWSISVKFEGAVSTSPLFDLPYVLEGKGFGIVEDCGGVLGLEELVEAFKEKNGDSYERFRDWLDMDDFDITMFDIDDMNFRLKKLPSTYAKIYENQ